MKLNNEVFFNDYFTSAFKKLLDFDLDSPITLSLVKSIKVLDEQQYAVMLTKDKLIDRYAKRDESGNLIMNNGNIIFNSSEDAKEFEEKFINLLRDEFEIPMGKIKLNKAHKISGNHLRALLDIVEVIDDGGK